MKEVNKYKYELANYLGVAENSITLFWKGRVALYGLLKSLGVKEGDEVILPAFTCVVVPNAIIYLGAKPVYVDIDSDTYNIDVSLVESKINSKTKVILAQNTFGLSCDIDALMILAEKYNLKVIEDCTHGIGGAYKGKKNGTIAHAAFFSSQWNKPFSTGIGGMAIVKDQEWAKKMNQFEASCQKASFKDSMMLRVLFFIRTKLLFPFLYWTAIKVYRWMSKHKIVTGSSDDIEITGTQMPKNYLKGMGSFQCKRGVKSLKDLDRLLIKRIELAEKISLHLKKLNQTSPFEPDYSKHTFIKYPLLVKDRTKFIDLAEKESIEIGDWFLSPLHPVKTSLEPWCFASGHFPNAEFASKHIINLPTHQDINERYLNRILKFLEKNKSELLNK